MLDESGGGGGGGGGGDDDVAMVVVAARLGFGEVGGGGRVELVGLGLGLVGVTATSNEMGCLTTISVLV